MKWKHKLTGWVAKTDQYKLEYSDGARFSYEVGGLKHKVYLPTNLIQADENWEEIPDDRWLRESFTVEEFMKAFAMVITEEAAGHDSVVAKGMVDRRVRLYYGPQKEDKKD